MEEFALDFLLKPWKYDYFDPDCHIGAATTFKVYTIDLQVYAALSKKQYGFKWGSSTLAATQNEARIPILNQGMARGAFLDIEGAFDIVSLDAMNKL